MFRTSCIHHQEDYIVHAVFYGVFSCIYVSSVAGGRVCSIEQVCILFVNITQTFRNRHHPAVLKNYSTQRDDDP